MLDDIAELAELSRRYDRALGLRPDNAASFLGWIMRLPYIDLLDDSVVIVGDEATVGFALVTRDPASEGSSLHWFGIVDPERWGRALGSALVAWAIGRAEERALVEGAFPLRTMCPAQDAAAHELFTAVGFAHVRTMWDMHRDLPGEVSTDVLPDGVTIRSFQTGRDERTFWQVSEAAFEGHFGMTPSPYESWEGEWYRSDDWNPDRVLLAESDGEVVGELGWVDATPDGYIASLGVLEAHRGRGIAKALLRRAFSDIAQAGLAHATLSVDTENATGAVGLYRSVGMQPVREAHVFEREST
jgi:mycothiol synthase